MSSRILSVLKANDAHSIRWPETGELHVGELSSISEPGPEPVPAPEVPVETVEEVSERLHRQFQFELESEKRKAFEEGKNAGIRQSMEEYRLALESTARSAADLAALKPKLRKQAEQDLVQLAFAIARRIVRRELTVDPAALLGIVQAALLQLQSAEVLRLRLHPADRALVAALEGRIVLPPLHADANLARGTLLFDCTNGSLDASVETQFAEIEKGLADRLGKP